MTAPPPSHPHLHPACLSESDLLAQCDMGKKRTSGPGGQHRNKVETGVFLTHKPTGLEAHAGERRSVIENKRVAVRRLRLLLATEERRPVPKGEARSPLWIQRTHGGKVACNPQHWDFPSLLAEAMDMLFTSRGDATHAAIRLAVTMSQLVKFVKDHPPAFIKLNAWRMEAGEHPLK